jgi:hypothetical protein
MLSRVPSLLACSALLMATAVHAQSQPAAPPSGAPVITPMQSVVSQPKVFVPSAPAPAPSVVSPVTVQAAPGPVAAQKEARDFVQSYAATSPAIDQIARWHAPICISVAGLTPDQAARVAARIQEVGEGVGMHALPPGCKANIEVVFTDQPQAFMDKVANTREEILGYYHRHDRDKLKAVTRPVQAWYVTQTSSGSTTRAGLAFVGLTTSVGAASGTGGGPDGAFVNTSGALNSSSASGNVVDDPDNHGPVGCSEAPQFTHCLQSELNNVLIVIDTSRIQGQKLGPLTDYLSMLALAQVRSLDGCAALPSVIDRLGRCADKQTPDGLTPADAAYLTALYASNLESNKPLEQDEIASRMSSILVHPR